MPARKGRSQPPPRPEVLAFLQEAKARPDDDTPRLVLADWLEENGDAARAEFIRLHLRRTRVREGEVLEGPGEREKELIDRHAVEWLGPLHRDVTAWLPTEGGYSLHRGPMWSFTRGLVRLVLPAEEFLNRATQRLAGTEAWAWVEALELQGVTPETAAAVAASPLLATLAELDFAEFDFAESALRDAGLLALFVSPHLGQLRSLALRDNGITAAGLEAVAGVPFLGQLHTLDLGANQLGVKGARSLAALPLLARVRDLRLDGANLGDGGVTALAGSQYAAGLERLDLFATGLTDDGAEALATSPYLTRLRELNLAGNDDLSDATAWALARSKTLKNLERVAIDAPTISDRGWAALQNRFGSGLDG